MSLPQRSPQLSSTKPTSLAPTRSLPFASVDVRRSSHRVRTVYRVVRIETDSDQGFARVRNMSDGGMKLSLTMPVTLGDTVRVALSDETELEGRVVWSNGNDCGLQFTENVDSILILQETAQQARSAQARSPRLRTGLTAVATTDRGTNPVIVEDVSLRGMKVLHDGSFTPGLPVKVCFGSGVERRGIVRWANEKVAGLMLLDQFAVEELGAVSALDG